MEQAQPVQRRDAGDGAQAEGHYREEEFADHAGDHMPRARIYTGQFSGTVNNITGPAPTAIAT
jgi:hypothetical protein